MTIASLLIAFAGPIAELIDNAMSDDYDKEKELQALLRIGRAVSDARMEHLLRNKP